MRPMQNTPIAPVISKRVQQDPLSPFCDVRAPATSSRTHDDQTRRCYAERAPAAAAACARASHLHN
jgi:hypothetical protein